MRRAFAGATLAAAVGFSLLAVVALPLAGCARSTARTEAAAAPEPAAARELAAAGAAAERSAALFTEAGKVLTHPRCVNCHPARDRPLQGERGEPHQPWVRGGEDGGGAVGMRCAACHQEQSFDPGRVPGAPHWLLAPVEMAWEGRTVGEICEQIKDRSRNGDRSLDEIVAHMREDPLVGWGWAPGAGREPAPGSRSAFADLIAEWVETGAVCPES